MNGRAVQMKRAAFAFVLAFALWPGPIPAESSEAGPRASAESERILDLAGDRAYGEYLGGECVTCHQRAGAMDGVPAIHGLPRGEFVRALVEYRLAIRSNEVMSARARGLSNEEIAALAEYFASLEPN